MIEVQIFYNILDFEIFHWKFSLQIFSSAHVEMSIENFGFFQELLFSQLRERFIEP